MAKATHKGTCQACGAMQKLPNGTLSQHGYTVDYGFFSGVCRGHNQLPYEEDCSFIVEMIKQVEAQLAKVEKEIAAPTYYLHTYYIGHRDASRLSTTSGHKTTRLPLDVEDAGECSGYSGGFSVMVEDGNYQSGISDYSHTKDFHFLLKKETIKIHNRKAEQMRLYIEWQKKRIAEWKPAELTPV